MVICNNEDVITANVTMRDNNNNSVKSRKRYKT